MASISNMAALPVFGNVNVVRLADILDPSLDAKLGRESPETTAHLSRVVYIPSHGDATSHLPLYDVTESYSSTVGTEPIGTGRYKLGLAMMRRPSGHGTNDNVRYLVDFDDKVGGVNATVERRLPTLNGAMVAMEIPKGADHDFSIKPLNTDHACHLNLTSSLSFPIPDTTTSLRPLRHPWFAIHHEDGQPPSLEWQTFPREYGPLRYNLVECGSGSTGDKPTVHAVYHHLGFGFGLPHDCSEGVLLLSENLSDEAEALAVASLLGLLRQVRRINRPPPKTKKSIIKRLLGKV